MGAQEDGEEDEPSDLIIFLNSKDDQPAADQQRMIRKRVENKYTTD